MSWRFFWVVSALMVAFVVNAYLIGAEDIKPPVDEELQNGDARDELAKNDFYASTRGQNFREFGLPDDLADAAEKKASELANRRGKHFADLLNRDADLLAPVFCPGGPLPQRYAALEVFVVEENGERMVIDGMSFISLEPQPWFKASWTDQVYQHIEWAPERRPDSTAVGIAAILTSQEQALLDDKAPWKAGIGSRSLGGVIKKYPDVALKLVHYMALMHVFTEIANKGGGLCAGS